MGSGGGGGGGGGLKPPITFIRSNMVSVNEFVSRENFSVTHVLTRKMVPVQGEHCIFLCMYL